MNRDSLKAQIFIGHR